MENGNCKSVCEIKANKSASGRTGAVDGEQRGLVCHGMAADIFISDQVDFSLGLSVWSR